jgi:hypothetical protein
VRPAGHITLAGRPCVGAFMKNVLSMCPADAVLKVSNGHRQCKEETWLAGQVAWPAGLTNGPHTPNLRPQHYLTPPINTTVLPLAKSVKEHVGWHAILALLLLLQLVMVLFCELLDFPALSNTVVHGVVHGRTGTAIITTGCLAGALVTLWASGSPSAALAHLSTGLKSSATSMLSCVATFSSIFSSLTPRRNASTIEALEIRVMVLRTRENR